MGINTQLRCLKGTATLKAHTRLAGYLHLRYPLPIPQSAFTAPKQPHMLPRTPGQGRLHILLAARLLRHLLRRACTSASSRVLTRRVWPGPLTCPGSCTPSPVCPGSHTCSPSIRGPEGACGWRHTYSLRRQQHR